MPHNFLVPAQTLLIEINKLIVAENKKQTQETAKKEIIKVLIAARNGFIATEKKYRNLFTTNQATKLSFLLERLEEKTPEFLRLIDVAETAITHFSKDVKEDDSTTPVLEQIFNARVLKKEMEANSQSSSDSESNEDTESEVGSDFNEKALALVQDSNLFSAQLMEVKKKQEVLEPYWRSFFETMDNCNIARLEEAHQELKGISKTLINALYEIQTNNNIPRDDLGMILAYKKVTKGPILLHDNFQVGMSRADEIIVRLAQQIGYSEEMPAYELAPTSPTDSTVSASVSSCSSSFFSSSSSLRSNLSSANDDESQSDLDEVDEPPRKCARHE